MTGCQLLKKPKIAATVRGLEAVLAQEIEVSRQGVIAQLVGATELARELKEPGAMVSALRNVGQICGYYRQEVVAPKNAVTDGALMDRLDQLSDKELADLIEGERSHDTQGTAGSICPASPASPASPTTSNS